MIFKNINSLQELKTQYKKLAMKHHPDMGGNVETMQELNNEFDMLFKVWKVKNKLTETKETAASFTSEFYTQNGWQGSNYNINLTTKEIAKILRDAIKLMYPLCKFSVIVRHYTSIDISLMQAPYNVFTNCTNDKHIILNQYHILKDERITEQCRVMFEDIKSLVCSYNYDDSDAMIDYFDTNFYYNFNIGKWDKPFRVVEKVARIGQKPNCKDKGITLSDKQAVVQETQTTSENNYSYDIKEDIDTRDNTKIYVVKIVEKLEKDEYIKVNNFIKSLGGYYSKFKHGFIFKDDPTEKLTGKALKEVTREIA